MAGHSKWSKVKRIKGALDQKRSRLFSKLAKEITVAAKLSEGDPSENTRLRSAILAAHAQSMPNDNIKHAIKHGAGEGGNSQQLEEPVLTSAEEHFVITPAPEDLYSIAKALKAAGTHADSQKLIFMPDNTVPVSDEYIATQVIRLCEALDAYDDVQNVYSNFDFPEDLTARLSA